MTHTSTVSPAQTDSMYRYVQTVSRCAPGAKNQSAASANHQPPTTETETDTPRLAFCSSFIFHPPFQHRTQQELKRDHHIEETMKKRKIASTAYDEASSSDSEEDSSDDDSSSASSNGDGQVKNRLKPIDSGEEEEASDSDSDSDSGSGSGQEDIESSSAVELGKRASSRALEESEEDIESSAEEENDDEADLPLQERIQRKEALGLSLQKQRARKRSALEIASKRLAKYKKSKEEEDDSSQHADLAIGNRGPKKKSKHAPTEVSSKRSDFYRRGAPRLNESGVGVEIGARRYKPLDPRTSSLSGHLNEEQFENNYEFLQDMRNKEISQLKKTIVARNQTGKKGKRMRRQLNVSVADGSVEEDEDHLRKLKQERADFERHKVVRTAKQAVKKKIRSEVEEGTRGAFFLKRKEKKRLEFEAKMEELRKQRGGHKAVEKALAKRRQKAKSRDAGLFVK
jgi:ribosomal RNA-processing protein 36